MLANAPRTDLKLVGRILIQRPDFREERERQAIVARCRELQLEAQGVRNDGLLAKGVQACVPHSLRRTHALVAPLRSRVLAAAALRRGASTA